MIKNMWTLAVCCLLTAAQNAEPAPIAANVPNKTHPGLGKLLRSFGEPVQIQESKPVTNNNARFVAVAQTKWKPADRQNSGPVVSPLEIQLRITNLGKQDLLFPSSGAFGIKMFGANGKEVEVRNGPKGSIARSPLLLSAGATFAICRCAELRWNENANAAEFVFKDGTGLESVIGPLPSGRYNLVFWYHAPASTRPKRNIGPARWEGEVVTKEVSVEVLRETTRGYPPAFRAPRPPLKDPVCVQESKVVKVNDVEFVLVTQSNWNPVMQDQGVPIEVQLRITNLSKRDLVFPTFDSFAIRICDSAGKKLEDRGGRDLTIMPKPIVLPVGTSYSLGSGGVVMSRFTELKWNRKTQAADFHFGDGTGWESIIGPVTPGRHRLTFGYSVSPEKAATVERETNGLSTWHGAALPNMDIQVISK